MPILASDPATEHGGVTTGLRLLLDRSWGQEVIHQLVLRELLAHTSLEMDLGLWERSDGDRQRGVVLRLDSPFA